MHTYFVSLKLEYPMDKLSLPTSDVYLCQVIENVSFAACCLSELREKFIEIRQVVSGVAFSFSFNTGVDRGGKLS